MIKLLLIDDSALDLEWHATLIKDVFGPEEVDVVCAARPLPNLDEYAQFDGVLLDNDLQAELTGMELAKAIHAVYPTIPMGIFTGMEVWHSSFKDHEDHGVAALMSKNHVSESLSKLRGFLASIRVAQSQNGRRKRLRHERVA